MMSVKSVALKQKTGDWITAISKENKIRDDSQKRVNYCSACSGNQP